MSEVYRCLDAAEVMEIEGETLILNPNTFAVTKLNAMGGEVWRLLGECPTVEQLTDRLAAEYGGVSPERIQTDIRRFLDRMKDIGLVQLAE